MSISSKLHDALLEAETRECINVVKFIGVDLLLFIFHIAENKYDDIIIVCPMHCIAALDRIYKKLSYRRETAHQLSMSTYRLAN